MEYPIIFSNKCACLDSKTCLKRTFTFYDWIKLKKYHFSICNEYLKVKLNTFCIRTNNTIDKNMLEFVVLPELSEIGKPVYNEWYCNNSEVTNLNELNINFQFSVRPCIYRSIPLKYAIQEYLNGALNLKDDIIEKINYHLNQVKKKSKIRHYQKIKSLLSDINRMKSKESDLVINELLILIYNNQIQNKTK